MFQHFKYVPFYVFVYIITVGIELILVKKTCLMLPLFIVMLCVYCATFLTIRLKSKTDYIDRLILKGLVLTGSF